MDSLTHLAIGTMIGVGATISKPTKKAIVLGMIAHSVPDIDMIESWWLPITKDLIAHRGITHSLFGGFFMAIILGWMVRQVAFFKALSNKQIAFIVGAGILLHIVLDSFNNYGTGWLEPFSHHRFSFNSLYVIDPFFSIPIVLMSIVMLIKTNDRRWMIRSELIAWSWLFVYLCFSLYNKYESLAVLQASIRNKNTTKYFTTPAPFQTWMWMMSYEKADTVFVGYHSLHSSAPVQFKYYAKGTDWENSIADKESLQDLQLFSQGFYTIEKSEDQYYFNDLRFGQSFGWEAVPGRFVFRYSFSNNELNKTIIQKGRFEGWNIDRWNFYWEKVWGK